MKRLFLIPLLLLLAPLARAGQTIVTATITDPNGQRYANGSGRGSIVCPGNAAPTFNGFSVTRTTVINGLDGFGTFTQTFFDTSTLDQTGCGYQFSITDQTTTVSFTTPTLFTVTGISVNLSTQISAFAAPLPNSGGGGGGLQNVSSLPVLCTPGITNPVNLTTFPYGVYACTSLNTWTSWTIGSNGQINRFQPVLGTALTSTDFSLSGWGSGATIGSITGTDTDFQYTITAGTAPSSEPTVILTYHDGPWISITSASSWMTNGSGVIQDISSSSTINAMNMTYTGIPIAGSTYIINGLVMGNANTTNFPISVNPVIVNPTASQTVVQPGGTHLGVTGDFSVSGTTALGSLSASSASVSGALSVTGTSTLGSVTSLNNVYYVSQGSGADLGAKINSSVAACIATFTACKYVLDVGGTISTPPSFPVGSTVECTATGPITIATTWPLNHRNTVYNFNGCQFNYNQDSGNAAMLVGKNLSGVLTCNGTTNATWVSGSQFGTFDPGDQLSIGSAHGFNVGTGSTATNLVLTTTCSLGASQTYASTSLGNVANIGASYPGSVTIRDLNLSYTGAGTQNNIGLQYDFVTNPLGNSIRVVNFTTGSGFYARGMLIGNFTNLILDNDRNAFTLDAGNHSGISITSNDNHFTSCEINNSTAGGKPFYITGASNGNTIMGCDFEGNAATVFGTIDAGSFKNRIMYSDQEANGDGTTNATDWAVSAADNEFIGNIFVGTGNFPNKGIVGNTSAANTVLRDNVWLSFSSGYAGGAAAFSGSGYSVAQDNNIGSLSFTGFITNEDLGGNYFATSMQPGAGIGVGALPSAAANAGKWINISDSTAITAEGQACVGSSTHKAVAFSDGTQWKCF